MVKDVPEVATETCEIARPSTRTFTSKLPPLISALKSMQYQVSATTVTLSSCLPDAPTRASKNPVLGLNPNEGLGLPEDGLTEIDAKSRTTPPPGSEVGKRI